MGLLPQNARRFAEEQIIGILLDQKATPKAACFCCKRSTPLQKADCNTLEISLAELVLGDTKLKHIIPKGRLSLEARDQSCSLFNLDPKSKLSVVEV